MFVCCIHISSASWALTNGDHPNAQPQVTSRDGGGESHEREGALRLLSQLYHSQKYHNTMTDGVLKPNPDTVLGKRVLVTTAEDVTQPSDVSTVAVTKGTLTAKDAPEAEGEVVEELTLTATWNGCVMIVAMEVTILLPFAEWDHT